MKARPLYCTRFGAPSYHRRHLGDWEWSVTDGEDGPVLASGHTITERGAQRAIERVVCRCVPVSGICRCDLPVLHPLTWTEVGELNARLALEKVPVTVRTDNPDGEVVLWPALTLTTAQQVHAMHVVKRKTDAPVHWAGAGR